VFYTSPKAKGQTVITDAQRVKELIEQSKGNFFQENTDDTSSVVSGSHFNSNNPLNYDDDYYSEEESAELNANFVGKDYSDDDEFYDYEEYDSIVNRRDQILSRIEKVQKSNDYDEYEYYDDNDETTSVKQFPVSPERQKSNQYGNIPLNDSFKRRHSFSSVDHRNEDYDETDYDWKEGDYNDDDLAQKEEIYQYARATTYPPLNHHITYDGRNKYYPEEEQKEPVPNYQPLLPSYEDEFRPISDDVNAMQQGNLI
jgi:hypothetical protein